MITVRLLLSLSLLLSTLSYASKHSLPANAEIDVFIDPWNNDLPNAKQALEQLEASYSADWWVPNINITEAQLQGIRDQHTDINALKLDYDFKTMRSFGMWQTPSIVVSHKGKVHFKGNIEQFQHYIKTGKHPTAEAKSSTVSFAKPQPKQSVVHAQEPGFGETLPQVSIDDLNGNTVVIGGAQGKKQHLLFVDTLCPMPHWPNCEAIIQHINQRAKSQPNQKWIAIAKSFYVDQGHAKSFAEHFDLAMPMVFDGDNALFQQYQVYGNPYLVVLDQHGAISHRESLGLP